LRSPHAGQGLRSVDNSSGGNVTFGVAPANLANKNARRRCYAFGMTIRNAVSAIAALLIALLLSSCGTTRVSDRWDKDRSIVAIYLDLTKTPVSNAVTVWYQDLEGKKSWTIMRNDGEGLYFIEYMPMGQVWLAGGSAGSINVQSMEMPQDPATNPTTLRITKPAAYYMGAFRYEPVDKKHFRMARLKEPIEREAMKRLLPFTEGTPYSDLVKKRIASP
jgi:hypothetical protein